MRGTGEGNSGVLLNYVLLSVWAGSFHRYFLGFYGMMLFSGLNIMVMILSIEAINVKQ